MDKMQKRKGFTLAEVLIVLGVIGIVAAMTIPTLINNYQEKVTVTKVKKIYSVLSNAQQLSVLDYGRPSEWGITGRDAAGSEEAETYNAVNAILIRDRVLKHVKTAKVCNNAKNQKECGIADKIYYARGDIDTNISGSSAQSASALLVDGSSIVCMANGGNGINNRGMGELSRTLANILYDVNGIKAPNTYGKDIFMFYLTENSIIPSGSTGETLYQFQTHCTKDTGHGCTAWIIYNGNMDYLHCKDLSWNGKHKCSD